MRTYAALIAPEQLTPNEQEFASSKTTEIIDRLTEFKRSGITRSHASAALHAQYRTQNLEAAAHHLGVRGDSNHELVLGMVNAIYGKRDWSGLTSKLNIIFAERDRNRFVPYGSTLEFDQEASR